MTPLTLPAICAAAGLALAVACHVSTWGAYKDSPYEGYHPTRQLRSLVLAVLAAASVATVGGLDLRGLLPGLGLIYSLERLATEWWKTIVRAGDQSAYAIPMRLGFRGRPVDAPWVRYGVGVGVAAALVLTGVALHRAQATVGAVPWWLATITVGAVGGWATALGGAWKDAQIEGFSGWKFVRSPAVATAWGFPLSLLTSDWVVLCMAAGGMAVASIETYKTFLTRGRPPGKFAGKQVRWSHASVRHRLGVGHATAWGCFALIAVAQAIVTRGVQRQAAATVAMFAAATALTVLHLNRTTHALSAAADEDPPADPELVGPVAVRTGASPAPATSTPVRSGDPEGTLRR